MNRTSKQLKRTGIRVWKSYNQQQNNKQKMIEKIVNTIQKDEINQKINAFDKILCYKELSQEALINNKLKKLHLNRISTQQKRNENVCLILDILL